MQSWINDIQSIAKALIDKMDGGAGYPIAGVLALMVLLLIALTLWLKIRKAGRRPPESEEDAFPLEAEDDGVIGKPVVVDRRQTEASRKTEDMDLQPPPPIPDRKSPLEKQTPAQKPAAEAPMPFFQRLKNGLSKTRRSFTERIEGIIAGGRGIDADTLEEIEELLITSDIGVQTSADLIAHLSAKKDEIRDASHLKETLKEEILSILTRPVDAAEHVISKPRVIMVVGVNGVGKTTSIGKLAARFTSQGKKVLIAAADTFRAAAVEQLTIWAERSGADIVRHKEGADPAAVAYDGVEAAMARNVDVVLIDTAGRLHTKVNLMEELKKIKRSVAKKMPGAPHETLMILDATTGQNALSQARLFHEAIGITGFALTKLDGTAKGGIVVGICGAMRIPLKFIGVGESIDDLQDFDPREFVEALF